jgi:class 3 adenylate cyclase
VQESPAHLSELDSGVHCDSCGIDFEVNLANSVELTFVPNPAVREVDRVFFCVAGPQVTPHVALQQVLPPDAERTLSAALEPGRYRLRAGTLRGSQPILVGDGGSSQATVTLEETGWPEQELRLTARAALRLVNSTPDEHRVVLERTAWSDQSATAAEVTALQVFRDLFSNEVLRPGEPVSVGTLAVVFTDLLGSTRFYRELGDAPAFGAVADHLELLRAVVGEEGGAVVKTMGDAIMAVFRRPADAVTAVLRAQREAQPLVLKAGVHYGPCIAISQNDRLDYFGTTVNAASRLAGLSNGTDVVVSAAVHSDPDVAALALRSERVILTLKGFDDEPFEIWRLLP